MRQLRPREERRRPVRAGRHTGPAADAGGEVQGPLRLQVPLGDVVGVRCGARGHVHGPARPDELVECRAVHYQVPDDREGRRPPRLQPEAPHSGEGPQVLTAGRGRVQRPVRHPVDEEAAGPAHPLPAVRLEDHRLATGLDDLVVEAVEQFEQTHLRLGVLHHVTLEEAPRPRPVLPPDLQLDPHR